MESASNWKQDLSELPLRAVVAFAYRCARRVLPLFQIPKETPARSRHYQSLDKAIRLSISFASGRQIREGAVRLAIDDTLRATRYVQGNPSSRSIFAANAARAAVTAVLAAMAEARLSLAVAAATAAEAATDADPAAGVAAIQDLMKLRTMELGFPGSLGFKIDPLGNGPLGPLWPNGAPQWFIDGTREFTAALLDLPYGQQVDGGDRLSISVTVGEFAPIDEVAAELANLYRCLNEAHIASGGSGLVIDDWQLFVAAPEPAEVL